MSNYSFANNASTTLGSAAASTDTTITVASGTGSQFPVLTSGQFFMATLASSTTGLPNEIVKVTGRVGDTMTVVRAQEGTTAQSWAIGTRFANFVTAGFLNQIVGSSDLQSQSGNYAADSGAANAGVIVLTPAPASLAALVGVPLRILKNGAANTGAYTLNVNSLGAQPVKFAGAALQAGMLAANTIFEVSWDGSAFDLLSGPAATYNANLAQMAAATIKGNITGATALPTDIPIATLLQSFAGVAQILNATQLAFSIPLVLSGATVLLQVRAALVTLEAGGSVTNTPVTFPEPFSTHCIGVLANQASRASPTWTGLSMGTVQGSVTVNGCTLSADTGDVADGQSGATAFYVAIGY